jgi:hypothetical protein
VAQVVQTSLKEGHLAPFLNEPFATLFVPSRFDFATLDGALDGHPRAIEPSRQLICRHGHCRSSQTHSQQFEQRYPANAAATLLSRCEPPCFVRLFASQCQNCVVV